MKKYEIVEFSSDSKFLDRLVKQCQYIPSQRIINALALSGAPQQDALNSAVNLIGRISGLSPDSPGGNSIPKALEICWGTYMWLQQWVLENPIVAKDPGKYSTVSYDEYLESVKE